MKNLEKINALLGFAQKAGKLVSGDNTCRAKFKKIHLIVLASDCSPATNEYYRALCHREKKPILTMGNRVELGTAIGKSPRTVLGITDVNFARQILQLITGEERE
ncbi:L7Ae/L30e/S12e/Gadd45 family ribosomal protein [Zhaonella formicivorans]|uniref:L7Ae/L30e/S12e/Gadd45 family ribosomal protein n=1 Tax=Zhaonella formicivorans TaxID=2528593 RepID=UPI0010E6420C|nr:L7Ae/L30e/S12e/Gadd45 family ribosomal protein [Zhaonella formicivorans]